MKLGLIGYPLGHSWSPEIHQLLIGENYELMPLRKEELHTFMTNKKFDGINVTIPYKQDVIPYLDEIEENAKQIGAINCIKNQDGKLIGYNTDYLGFIQMLDNHHIDVKGRRIAVLGSGGSSKAITHALHTLDGEAIVVSRTKKDGCITYEELYETQSSFQIIVNTTPIGMYPNCDATPIDLYAFTNLEAVVDIIANPLRTKLQFDAKQLGINTCGGFEMLVGQAFYADQIFLGQTLDKQSIIKCQKELMKERRNIVLIGMPTSGKSTIAKMLSEITKRPCVEMDEEIVNKLGTSISDCFATKGEDYFRSIETEVAKENREAKGTIISCGGGVIKIAETMRYLSENGLICWIERDLSSLFPTDDRPLASDIANLQKLYEERLPLYQKYSDVTIDNHGKIEETLQQILSEIQ